MTLDPRDASCRSNGLGIAGRLADAFMESKLTPLLVLFALALGALAIVVTPREEEPQIKVPMIDVFAPLPGRAPVEVERQVRRPSRRTSGRSRASSTSTRPPRPAAALLVVRFRVGEDPDRALVRIRAKLDALAGDWPRDAAAAARQAAVDRRCPDLGDDLLEPDAGLGDAAPDRGRGGERDQDDPGGLGHGADRRPAAGIPRGARPGAAGRPGPGPRRGPPAPRGREPADGRRARSLPATGRSWSRPAASCGAPRSSSPSSWPRAAAGRFGWATSRASSTVPRSLRPT